MLARTHCHRARRSSSPSSRQFLRSGILSTTKGRVSAQVFSRPGRARLSQGASRTEEPALGLIFDLCAMASERSAPGNAHRRGSLLRPYGELPIEDYMVSLYNVNTAQRVVIAEEMGNFQVAHQVLHKAITYIKTAGPLPVIASGRGLIRRSWIDASGLTARSLAASPSWGRHIDFAKSIFAVTGTATTLLRQACTSRAGNLPRGPSTRRW